MRFRYSSALPAGREPAAGATNQEILEQRPVQHRSRLSLVLTTLMLIATSCTSGEGTGTTSEAASADTTEVPVMTTPPASSAGVELCEPSEPACGGPLAPGTHTTAKNATTFTYEVPEGWSKGLDVPGSFNLESAAFPSGVIAVIPDWVIATQTACTKDPEPGLGRTAEDLVTFLIEHEGLIASNPEAISIGGLQGQMLEVRKNPDWSGSCPGQVSLFTHRGTINDPGWWTIDDAIRMLLYVLDAGQDHTVTVHLETLDEASFEDFVQAATPIVESIRFAAASPSLTLTETGCQYDGPGEVPAGETAVFISNKTGATFRMDFWLLRDGHEYEELVSHIDDERRRSEAGEPPLGHPSFARMVLQGEAEPGETVGVVFDADPGVYGAACIRFEDEPTAIWAAGPTRVTD